MFDFFCLPVPGHWPFRISRFCLTSRQKAKLISSGISVPTAKAFNEWDMLYVRDLSHLTLNQSLGKFHWFFFGPNCDSFRRNSRYFLLLQQSASPELIRLLQMRSTVRSGEGSNRPLFCAEADTCSLFVFVCVWCVRACLCADCGEKIRVKEKVWSHTLVSKTSLYKFSILSGMNLCTAGKYYWIWKALTFLNFGNKHHFFTKLY